MRDIMERLSLKWKQRRVYRETIAQRTMRLQYQAVVSERNRLVRRPAEDSDKGYARIQAARLKRARRNAKRRAERDDSMILCAQ